MKIIEAREHERIGENVWKEEYKRKNLIRWEGKEHSIEGEYWTYFRVGTEWLNKEEALIVTPKNGVENIDFMKIFMVCLNSDIESKSFSTIYEIDFNQPTIPSPVMQNVLNPLLVVHFLSIVKEIVLKGLKKGYLHREENLKKVRGRIRVWPNEKENILPHRLDRVNCAYDEFSVDIPENRLIKKALRFTSLMLQKMRNYPQITALQQTQIKCEIAFSQVSDDIQLRDVPPLRSHKLFREYSEALRLARLILRRFDFTLSKVTSSEQNTPVFWLDMALLFEHYVHGLLFETYRKQIEYQTAGTHGERPDFLFKSSRFCAIFDAKYTPNYESVSIDHARQLCAYARDRKILKHLGQTTNYPVPCVVIYPIESNESHPENPFSNIEIFQNPNLKKSGEWEAFYTIGVPLPRLFNH